MSEPAPTSIPALLNFGTRLDALARTPTLETRLRRAYDFRFPRMNLNAGDLDSQVIRVPANAHFVVRQIVYSVTSTSNPVALGKMRITTASSRRANFQWMNELTELELVASANPRIPHCLSKPILIEPGSSVTLELQNTTTSSHSYDVTLIGELVFDILADEIEAFMSHNWYGFRAVITPAAAALTSNFFELRNPPDADFFLTHLVSMTYGPSNNAAVGPVRLQILPSSQGDPMMDNYIASSLLVGSYYNLTTVPVLSMGPSPLPDPYFIEANGSMTIAAVQPDNAAPADLVLFLEGVKVFK